MIRRSVWILLTLLTAAVAVGLAQQQPAPGLRIAGMLKIKPHELARLRAEGVPEKAAILWRISPGIGVDRATTPRHLLEFVAPPGKYSVDLLAIRLSPEGDTLADEARVDVEIEACEHPGPSPVPPQPTPPNPGPQPSPPQPAPPGAGRLDPAGALFRIQFGKSGCTATVIGPRRSDGRWNILTANHCIREYLPDGRMGPGTVKSGKLLLKDNTQIGVTLASTEAKSDVAWLVTDQTGLDLPYAHLAAQNPAKGTPVWHAGYGVDRPGNREEGEVISPETLWGQTQFLLSVSSGDSGGGIFRADTNEVVSTVCCTAAKGQKANMLGGSVNSIRRLMSADGSPPRRPQPWIEERRFQETPWGPVEIPLAWEPAPIPTIRSGWLSPLLGGLLSDGPPLTWRD